MIPTGKIEEILNTIDTYKGKIEEIKVTYIDKINKKLEKLEEVLNSVSTRSQVWIEMQVKKITKSIQDIIDSMMKKIKKVVNSLHEWANTAFDNLSASLIMSSMSKIGVDLTRDAALSMTDMIPLKLPPLDSLIPKIELELQLPELSSLASMGTITLPRL